MADFIVYQGPALDGQDMTVRIFIGKEDNFVIPNLPNGEITIARRLSNPLHLEPVAAAPVNTVPAQMAAPSLVVDSSTQVTVTLAGDPANGGAVISRRDIRYSADGEIWTTIPGVTSPHAVTDLVASTGYFFQTRAANAVGDGPWSTSATATTQAAPVEVTVSSVSVGAYNMVTDTIPVTIEGTNIAAGQTATVVIQPQADGANGPNPVATFTGPLAGTSPFTLNFTAPIGIPFAIYRAHVSIAGSDPFASNTFAVDTTPATLINPMASLSGADINAAVASNTVRGVVQFGLRLASSPVLSEETLRAGSGEGLVSFASIEATNANTHTFPEPQPGTYRVDVMQVGPFGIASAVITASTDVVVASGPLFADSFDAADGYAGGNNIPVTSANWDILSRNGNVAATVNPIGTARIVGGTPNENLRIVYSGAVTNNHEVKVVLDSIFFSSASSADPTLIVRASGVTLDENCVRALFRRSDNALILSEFSGGATLQELTFPSVALANGIEMILRISGTTATVLSGGTVVATMSGVTITGGKPGWGAFLGNNGVTNRVSLRSVEVRNI